MIRTVVLILLTLNTVAFAQISPAGCLDYRQEDPEIPPLRIIGGTKHLLLKDDILIAQSSYATLVFMTWSPSGFRQDATVWGRGPTQAWDLRGDHLYNLSTLGLQVLDVSNLAEPREIQFLSLPQASAMTFLGERLFVGESGVAIRSFDVDADAMVVPGADLPVGVEMRNLVAYRGRLAASSPDSGLVIYAVDASGAMAHVSTTAVAGVPAQLAVVGSDLLVRTEAGTIEIYGQVDEVVTFRESIEGDVGFTSLVGGDEGAVLMREDSGIQTLRPTAAGYELGERTLERLDPAAAVAPGAYLFYSQGRELAAYAWDHRCVRPYLGSFELTEPVVAACFSRVAGFYSHASGVSVVDLSDPQRIRVRSRIPLPSDGVCEGRAVFANGHYVHPGPESLEVYDVRDLDHPRHVATFPLQAQVTGLAGSGDGIVYAQTDAGTLWSIDLENLDHPVVRSRSVVPVPVASIIVTDIFLYVVSTNDHFYAYRLANSLYPQPIGNYDGVPGSDSLARNSLLYVLRPFRLKTYLMNGGAPPTLMHDLDLWQDATSLSYANGVIYASGPSGIGAIDVANPFQPTLMGTVTFDATLRSVVSFGGVLVGLGEGGRLEILRRSCAETVAGEPCGLATQDLPAVMAAGTGRGATWLDLTGNGYPDLVYHAESQGQILLNDRGRRLVPFLDLEVAGRGQHSSCAARWNDGASLIYVGSHGGPNTLLRVADSVQVTDVTPPLLADANHASTAAWFDADADGLLDLYLVNEDAPNRLFRNEGGLDFTDAADEMTGDPGEGRAVAIGDYDDDGDPDLYLSNRGPNRLLRNDGGFGFTDVTTSVLADAGEGKGACWGDADGDGDLDLYLVNQHGANRYFRNDEGTLVDATYGPLGHDGDGRDAAWIDMDNDGDLDLMLADSRAQPEILVNDGRGGFSVNECAVYDVPPFIVSMAPADFDADGDPDLLLAATNGESALFRNDGGQGFHWARLRLVGDTSNPEGLGARVRVLADGRWRMRELTDGAGYLSRGPHQLHFGLGTYAWVDSLVVHWPGGRVDRFADLPTDRLLTLREGGVVPNLLADRSVDIRQGRVELSWTLTEAGPDDRCHVLRRNERQGWFVPLAAEAAQGDGEWTLTDASVQPGATYVYRVMLGSGDGEAQLFETTAVEIPALATDLLACTPNPFNPQTTIRYALAVPGPVTIDVYDLDGRRVRRLVAERRAAGEHTVDWDGRDDASRRLGSGTYLVRLTTGDERRSRRISLIR